MQPTTLDSSPRALADLVDGLAQGLLEGDREAAGILIAARESLRNLGYNRWARRATQHSKACTVRRRHQGRREVSRA